jgi:hypothetical protein
MGMFYEQMKREFHRSLNVKVKEKCPGRRLQDGTEQQVTEDTGKAMGNQRGGGGVVGRQTEGSGCQT